jgi:hypothetical protein
MFQKILMGLIPVLIIIQFIRPTRNVSDVASQNAITAKYEVPEDVQNILKTSCNNCHSNNTTYPWYVNIQPLGWWLQNHVNEGKKHLNFDEFSAYPEKRAKRKFGEIEDEVKEGGMPLTSYTLVHAEAKLTPDQSKTLTDWASALK